MSEWKATVTHTAMTDHGPRTFLASYVGSTNMAVLAFVFDAAAVDAAEAGTGPMPMPLWSGQLGLFSDEANARKMCEAFCDTPVDFEVLVAEGWAVAAERALHPATSPAPLALPETPPEPVP